MFSTKPKATVKSVFAKFTADLEVVATEQQEIANDAENVQELLKVQLSDQDKRRTAALIEVTQAGKAIHNIGELLGITAK